MDLITDKYLKGNVTFKVLATLKERQQKSGGVLDHA